MSIDAISSSYTSTSTDAVSSTSSETSSILGAQDFLELLTVQLQNQDPLEPVSDTEFISQMANFSSLEAMTELNDSFATFAETQNVTAAQTYLGKQVTIPAENDDGETGINEVTGIVTAVSRDENGDMRVTVDGESYLVADIKQVALADSTTETI